MYKAHDLDGRFAPHRGRSAARHHFSKAVIRGRGGNWLGRPLRAQAHGCSRAVFKAVGVALPPLVRQVPATYRGAAASAGDPHP
jgi:hypothetical protein